MSVQLISPWFHWFFRQVSLPLNPFKVLLLIFIVPYKFLIRVHFNQLNSTTCIYSSNKSLLRIGFNTQPWLSMSSVWHSRVINRKKKHEELKQRCQPHYHKEAECPQSAKLQDQSTVLRTKGCKKIMRQSRRLR